MSRYLLRFIFLFAFMLLLVGLSSHLAYAEDVNIQEAEFIDEDPDEGEIGGVFTFTVSSSEHDVNLVEKYVVEFNNYGWPRPVALEVEPQNTQTYTYEIPMNTRIPDKTAFFVINGIGKNGEFYGGYILKFADNIKSTTLPTLNIPGPVSLSYRDVYDYDDRLRPEISASVNRESKDITHLVYYFIDDKGHKLEQIGQVPFELNSTFISYKLPENLLIPNNASAIAVHSRSLQGESKEYVAAGLWNLPAASPRNLAFIDEDASFDKVSGALTWEKALDESNIKNYSIFLVQESYGFGGVELGKVEANGQEEYSFDIPVGTPSGAELQIRLEYYGLPGDRPNTIAAFVDKNDETIKPRSLKLEQIQFSFYKDYYDGWNLSIGSYDSLLPGDHLNVYHENGNLLEESSKVSYFNSGGIVSIENLSLISKVFVSITNVWGKEGEKTEVLLVNPSPALSLDQIEVTDQHIKVKDIPNGDKVILTSADDDRFYQSMASYRSNDLVFKINEFNTSSKVFYISYQKAGMTEGPKVKISLQEVKKRGWVDNEEYWYYYNQDGVMVKDNWVSVSGKWYYMGTSGRMQTGWLQENGTWYYLDTNGVMKTGWVQVNQKWYYMEQSGAMKTGWVGIGGKWYYLDKSGEMKTGWVQDGTKWYYMDASGAMKTGWLSTGGKWYYLESSGAMQTGWLQLGTKWYYLNASGVMQVGSVKIGGKQYYFDKNGVWQ